MPRQKSPVTIEIEQVLIPAEGLEVLNLAPFKLRNRLSEELKQQLPENKSNYNKIRNIIIRLREKYGLSPDPSQMKPLTSEEMQQRYWKQQQAHVSLTIAFNDWFRAQSLGNSVPAVIASTPPDIAGNLSLRVRGQRLGNLVGPQHDLPGYLGPQQVASVPTTSAPMILKVAQGNQSNQREE
ncbi:hypothetical protein IV203_009753 [Nitzschia inconspicua]|uniref:Uncharacterized protein n=1 Tax=Nitzschia inconspicua TaxID=303405 RepID=A0A9K3KUT8_9STRA|nr:hypothetical protein IV203_009753 [Nitzschia inconspicua]